MQAHCLLIAVHCDNLACTAHDGTERKRADAINAEFTCNVLMLLRKAMNFVQSNTERVLEKLPDGRKN